MKILVAIPTRGEIWWETAMRFADIVRSADDWGIEIHGQIFQGNVSVVRTRNLIMDAFEDGTYDACLCFDDDVVPNPNILQIVQDAHELREPVASPCPIIRPGLPITPNIFRGEGGVPGHGWEIDLDTASRPEGLHPVDGVGHGCIALPRRVCEMRYVEGTSEDLDFCQRHRASGGRILVNTGIWSEHMLQIHGNGLATTYGLLLQQ